MAALSLKWLYFNYDSTEKEGVLGYMVQYINSMDSVKLLSDNYFSLIQIGDIQDGDIQDGDIQGIQHGVLLLYCVQAPRCPRIVTLDRHIGWQQL